jgi:GntR family transcriptional regulator/MocR family aminotransferase
MAAIPLDIVALDRRSAVPLQMQLYRALREAILHGRLRPGLRLPATRLLARDLSVARNTVVAVFEQLVAEGYLAARVGAGTVVAPLRPEALLHAQPPARRSAGGDVPALSRRGAALAAVRRGSPGEGGSRRRARSRSGFRPSISSRSSSGRGSSRGACGTPTRSALGYDYAAGLPALCEAIAQYLGAARGVVCRPEQVIVVAGAQAGLDLACRLLLDPGDAAWIEEPGYLGARGALLAASAAMVPVPSTTKGSTSPRAPWRRRPRGSSTRARRTSIRSA